MLILFVFALFVIWSNSTLRLFVCVCVYNWIEIRFLSFLLAYPHQSSTQLCELKLVKEQRNKYNQAGRIGCNRNVFAWFCVRVLGIIDHH